jgi:hypothetical protein
MGHVNGCIEQTKQGSYISLYESFSLAAASYPLVWGGPNVQSQVGSDRREEHTAGGSSLYQHEPFHMPLTESQSRDLTSDFVGHHVCETSKIPRTEQPVLVVHPLERGFFTIIKSRVPCELSTVRSYQPPFDRTPGVCCPHPLPA